MTRTAEIDFLLRIHHAQLVRTKKHRVFKLANGKIFVQSNSASDVRAEKNSLSVLRRLVREVPA
jgi:hypothetical protein